MSSEQLFSQALSGLTDIIEITLRFFLLGNLKKQIEALSKNKLFCRKAKHKTHCSLLTAHC
ncbi:MAG: hypothetical protein IKZ88_00060 [Neisseriaceae bacterium]|nr:hypothetical protein [Neisseriaceae bacterium]